MLPATDHFSRIWIAGGFYGARVSGLDIRETASALSARAAEVSAALGPAPFGDAEIRQFLATVPEVTPPTV
ncbi:hypothetical protein J2Y69_001385 [Microbacterium resistens]|uniref:Uncharacterized protein n=1 Tax=Microbacterium resistens TaxID=156977 RepID=A0ABU1SB04_9MICO|nr:hypothetical protein [Microbacterium resistens]MDR6866786.1 hypothetical protein [Microbacterium resistens]